MTMRKIDAEPEGVSEESRALKARWRTATMAAQWRFPGDWDVAEVDTTCQALIDDADVMPALCALGRARADAGVGLDETLRDVAVLYEVFHGRDASEWVTAADPDELPSRMLRAVATGWAEVITGTLIDSNVTDGLTGLRTSAYLWTRLHELYQAETAGGDVLARYSLITVSPQVIENPDGWAHSTAMILAADVLRDVFSSGETLALVSPNTIAVLAVRDARLRWRVDRATALINRRLNADPGLIVSGEPRISLTSLPPTIEQADSLLHCRATGGR